MSFFDYTLLLAPIYFLRVRGKFLTAAVLFGVSVYFSPRSLIFISVLSQTFSDRGNLAKRTFCLFVAVAGSVVLVLLTLTDLWSGKENVGDD